jgi:glycosyl hydrolase family 127 (putative beta-L-arabinofuranosidase)/beta-L-arabinofuranosidase (glycosyl hydrolase family 127)
LLSWNPVSTRRDFLAGLGSLGLSSAVLRSRLYPADVRSIEIQPSSLRVTRAVKNRRPLASNAFYPLPAGSIQPRDWLARQLRIQANGLSGHLDETWNDVGPTSGWLGGTGESWERGPYYLDGLLPLAHLLSDTQLKAKAQRFVDWTLDHRAANGMIGPKSNDDWWPRIVMLKALTQYYEFSGDSRVIPAMSCYFQYQLSELAARPLRDWAKFRWQDELLSVVWLYNRTGETYLLDLARLLHKQGYDWIAEFNDFPYKRRITSDFIKLNQGKGLEDLALATHGVNNGQAVKTGPIWSLISGVSADRDAARKMISELHKYHGLPNGMFSCDEHLAGLDPSQGSELCTVVEYMFSLETSLAITGDAELGDRLERLAFNALPGAFTDDMWAHQYNQEPNQVECSLHHRPWTTDGPESNLYGLEPNFGCCTANFHQGWPKFANSLFMLVGDQNSDANDGLVAVAYAPCEVRALIRDTRVHILEETEYPFRDKIRLTIVPDANLRFPLQLRVPAWAGGATIRVNEKQDYATVPGSFACINREWRPGDFVDLHFQMPPRVTLGFNQSISVDRGPLVFSLGVGESWVKVRDRGMTADWQVFPTDAWNYALAIGPKDSADVISVTESEVGAVPFSRRQASVELHVKAHKFDSWLAEDGVANPVPEGPVESANAEESLSLIPYGAAKLRITAFPQAKTEGDIAS